MLNDLEELKAARKQVLDAATDLLKNASDPQLVVHGRTIASLPRHDPNPSESIISIK